VLEVVEVTRRVLVPRAPSVEELPTEDGEPLESNWHRIQINLLVDVTHQLWPERNDYFVGGNMFVYYSAHQIRERDYRGPDFFVVLDVPGGDRKAWVAWEEGGRLPDIIIELLSPTTAEADLLSKKQLYERVFSTSNYFAYDPDTERLWGWHLNKQYAPLQPNERGWLWCETLQVWIGSWTGEYEKVPSTWVRFYRPDGSLVPTAAEAEATGRRAAQAEVERLQAELTRLRRAG